MFHLPTRVRLLPFAIGSVAALTFIHLALWASPEVVSSQASPPKASGQAATKAQKKAEPRLLPNTLPTVAVKLVDQSDAEAVAERFGAEVAFPIASLPGWYQFAFNDAAGAKTAVPLLEADAEVELAIQQVQSRNGRKTNDTYFPSQWHLDNFGQTGGTTGRDVDVDTAWSSAYTGSGVMVSIVDDGVETTHPDMSGTYNSAYAYDYVDNDTDPNPAIAADIHGTTVAGLAVAQGENNLGVAGVAYEADWTAVRLLGTGQSDSTEASALGHALANVDVYNNSWGPPDSGDYEDIGPLAKAAILNGVANGRGGLGAIYVWAGGNGSGIQDDSNLDAFANLPETIAVGSIDKFGSTSTYSEAGANILCVGPGGEDDVFSTDLVGAGGYNDGTLFSDNNYTNDFSGTSAAVPMVSGVVALMLDANPNLTWRDVQHILVHSSNHSVIAGGTVTNGAGLVASDRWGYGMVSGNAATQMANTWVNVPARVTLNSPTDSPNMAIPDNNAIGITRIINVPSNLYIEHVVVEFTTNHTFWGDLRVTLTSPSGTESKLATVAAGFSPAGSTWNYMSTRHWGEQAQGTWQLDVADELAVDTGDLQSWRIVFYGTNTQPTQTVSIGNTVMTDATAGVTYGHQFSVVGGSQQNNWTMSGNTPTGLNLNASTGLLSGTAQFPGTYNFTVDVTSYSPPGNATANVTLEVLPFTGGGGTGGGGGGGGGGGCAVGSSGLPVGLGALGVAILAVHLRRRRRLS